MFTSAWVERKIPASRALGREQYDSAGRQNYSTYSRAGVGTVS